MKKKELPIIFVLDMDECIIGKSRYILEYEYLINNYILNNFSSLLKRTSVNAT